MSDGDRQTVNFGSGAVRSASAEHLSFTSLSPVALLALARTAAEGATKYGAHNYELGMPVHACLEHAFRHMLMYLAGDRSEPHLPHAMWNLHAAIHSDTLTPEVNVAHLRGPGCTVAEAIREHLAAGKPERDRKRAAGEFADLGRWDTFTIPEVQTILCQQLGIDGFEVIRLDEETGRRVLAAAGYSCVQGEA